MKRYVLYCDRCLAEDGEEHPATQVVWIKWLGVRRIIRQDVCDKQFEIVTGQSSPNGAAPAHHDRRRATPATPAPGLPSRRITPESREILQKIRAAFEKTPRHHIDEFLQLLGGKRRTRGGRSSIYRLFSYLVEDGMLKMLSPGVYEKQGAPPLSVPKTPAEIAERVVALVKSHPEGIRASYLPPFIGISSQEAAHRMKRPLTLLRESGRIRLKGVKSAGVYYPGPKA